MHAVLKDFIISGSVSSAGFIVYAPIAFIAMRRPHLWLRFLDATELFLMRLGFSKRIASFGRGFSESRNFAISMVVLLCIFLLLVLANVIAYFYFLHRLT